MPWFELDKNAVLCSARIADKRQALELASEQLAHSYGLDTDAVLGNLLDREEQGSTGFGRGVAIPHGRVEGLEHPVAAILRCDRPVDFDSVDRLPVDIVIGLLSPAKAGASHLQALAHLSRLTRNQKTMDNIRGAEDSDAIYALVNAEIERDAA
ncbi:MAG: PTS sugar transporter subunit IIA [Blastomonas sp.]